MRVYERENQRESQRENEQKSSLDVKTQRRKCGPLIRKDSQRIIKKFVYVFVTLATVVGKKVGWQKKTN